ncbi:MAG: hypothetical protein ACI4Q6_07730 [Huintestinicola sp.]
MLKEILSPKSCAWCRICCIFDKYDVWETPVISAELKERIEAEHPEISFVSKGDSGAYIFNMDKCWDEKDEIFRCPALDPQKGCTLGENKPFDCSIWPFRVMNLGGETVISIASICPEMIKKPLSELIKVLDNGLGDVIFKKAEEEPSIIKPYENGYPILKVKKHD